MNDNLNGVSRKLYAKESTMNSPAADKAFTGSIPKLYQEHLVPMIFESYAADLAQRLAERLTSPHSSHPLMRVLEIAAGTGVLTRHLAAVLTPDVSIIATDLNQAMLDMAMTTGTRRPVAWQQADAMQLPFEHGEFEAVVCQFGVMFFPDKSQAFAEARRVLKPGGVLLFNMWDRIEENEFADTVTTALAALYPTDPPRFMARTPHGYHDLAVVERDLKQAGFSASPQFRTLPARSHAASPRIAAVAYCQATPLRFEIEDRDPSGLARATDVAEKALAQRFGAGAIDGKIEAFVVSIQS
jgi:ubiquinone/menaquinone biosynthesis C-methylase UbiE